MNSKGSAEVIVPKVVDDRWKGLNNSIDIKMNKSELCKTVKISSSTMAKLTKEEPVALTVLEKICPELSCNIADIMEFTELEEVRKNCIPSVKTVKNTQVNPFYGWVLPTNRNN